MNIIILNDKRNLSYYFSRFLEDIYQEMLGILFQFVHLILIIRITLSYE